MAQHGVVTTRQLESLGHSRKAVSKAARTGRLHRVHRRVYAVGHAQLTWEGHCLAAVLAHEPTLAGHTSAAWLWELRLAVEALLERTMGHPGHPRLREAMRIYRPWTRVTRPGLERRFPALLEAAALPLPATNVNVGAYELDCWWEAARFGVELDVYATHGSPLAFERDRERADDLLAIGVEITRVTDIRLKREPDAVTARVAAHLERRHRGLSHA